MATRMVKQDLDFMQNPSNIEECFSCADLKMQQALIKLCLVQTGFPFVLPCQAAQTSRTQDSLLDFFNDLDHNCAIEY